ncbi:MAG: hypothetical protein ABI425_04270 [Patescibacteria group bacterium]
MPEALERRLFGALIDIDGTLTHLGSVSWLDFTEQMYLMAHKPIGVAKEARETHKKIFGEFLGDIAKLKTKDEKEARIAVLNTDLFGQVWRASGLVLDRKTVEQISRTSLSMRLRDEGVRFLTFLRMLKEQLDIPVFVLTAAYSILSEVVAKDFGLSGGRAASQMIFDGDSPESLWVDFTLDYDLNRSKVRNADELIGEGQLPHKKKGIFAFGDGPTERELLEYYPNNAILSHYPIDSDRVSAYVTTLDEAMILIYDQLGPDGEKLVFSDTDGIAKIVRNRDQNG